MVIYVARGAGPHIAKIESALQQALKAISPLTERPPRVAIETNAHRLRVRLGAGGVDQLVIDARKAPETDVVELLGSLYEDELVGPIARERTWLAVDPSPSAAVCFAAGRHRLAGVLAEKDNEEGWRAIWARLSSELSRMRGGKVAICLAGGGTEGLFYHLGALRALQHFLPERNLADVDIVCGISAGAVVGGFLANGIGPDEITEGFRHGNRRVLPFRKRDLFDPNYGELIKRAGRLGSEVLRAERSPLSAAFRLPPAGLFGGKRLKRWLERQMTQPGMSNDFARTRSRFFVGATDMDTSDHVVFGSAGAPDVPIHTAIRASTALVPFYAPEQIDGRYYIDGGFTRTTNMRVAVQEGATMVILVDPLVPISTLTPGHVVARGGVYAMMQGLKQLINGRFDKAIPTLRAMYPHVTFHLFQPGEAARRVMAGSPMKYFYREEIVDIAYRETIREIRLHRGGALDRDFARHGWTFRDPARKTPEPPPSDRGIATPAQGVA